MKQSDNVCLDLYSKCLSKLQIDFIKESPSVIKDVIRLLKYWNHTEWIGLTSTCIEMIVVHEFRNDDTSRRFHFVDLLCAAIRSICVYSELKITWTDYYSPENYNSIHSSQPVILDPTNPYNNLHPGDNNPRKYNLQRIQCEATKLLARIMKHLPRI
ncbi:OAS [Mytilus coruscus]|uniref:OAS n=1 Tax=Mytilus coruscus TaxID=42192 RepID=A0A6J8EAR1_MYTCO|nr:OAS [Mytilus coruscus]